MTYDRVLFAQHERNLNGGVVSHLAELVRGDFLSCREGPLIRPFRHLLPKGRKDPRPALEISWKDNSWS